MEVFATSRALRAYYASKLSANQFIPKAITIGELFAKMVLVPHRRFIDPQTRLLLLAQASDFDGFMKLQIDRDLFSFLHNSEYIFRFFEELSGEKVGIEAIDAHDTYAEYSEHLTILSELLKRYEALLEARGLADGILLPKLYTLNAAYLESVGDIHVVLEGYLTAFELELLMRACAHITVTLTVIAHDTNTKMQARLGALGFDLKSGHSYLLRLNDATVLEASPYLPVRHITAHALSERVLQAAFVKRQVYEMTTLHGMDPASIVVVLPHEGFAETLALYDDENNFNFAMGLPFSTTLFYLRLQSVSAYFDHPTQEQKHRLARFMQGIESAFEVMRLHYAEKISMELFEKLIALFCVDNDASIQKIIDAELFAFKKLAPVLEGSSCKVYMKLFMQRLAQATLDDVRGGKITVMGVLETRGSRFDGVIVVDFNEEYVPKKSQKDLFLSSKIKAQVGLPTTADREALQKYFYGRLFEQAKVVSLSFVSSETQMPSRFLTELGISNIQYGQEARYSEILYAPNVLHLHPKDAQIISPYDFRSRPLSATALKLFLGCKRAFYYRYIAKLEAHEMPLDIPKEHEVGKWLHSLLQEVYTQQSHFTSVEALEATIEKLFASHQSTDEMGRYLVRLWLKRLKPFYVGEVARFEAGYRVWACEKTIQTKWFDVTLTGTIDRIDVRDGLLSIIDYKTGKIAPDLTPKAVEEATDFQLEFYALLAGTLGEIEGAYYYDLKEGVLKEEVMLEPKLARLNEILQKLSATQTWDFEQTDDAKQCAYCAYVHLCGRA